MKSDVRLVWRASDGGRRWLLGGLFAFVVLLLGVAPFLVWRERVQAAQGAQREPECLATQAKIVRRVTVNRAVNSAVGPTLRKFRIAMVATSAYFNAATLGGGTATGTAASLNSYLAGVNAIYEKEVGIRLERVGDEGVLTAAANHNFTNGDPNAMVDQVRTFFKNNLSAGAYDLGIVLGTGSGGTAYIGVVCETAGDAAGLYKGGAVALVNTSVGNDVNTRLIAHEIGHQFSAMHTQNANCANRFGETAYEPGSGVTLMSNAGSCGSDNIALARSAQFHAGSFEQINQYLSSFVGTSCATPIDTGNITPTVAGGLDYTIPKGTPFSLTATGNDLNGHSLTYTWEQMDAGRDDFANPPYSDQTGDPSTTTRPLFRPFDPGGTTRIFPSLNYILNYMNVPPDDVPPSNVLKTAERLPAISRTLNFRVTARDGHGGVNNDAVQLTVDGTAVDPQGQPFRVKLPNTGGSWKVNMPQQVEWAVANTGAGTNVNCGFVNILLSTDSGTTFTLLEGNVPNTGTGTGTGTATVNVPQELTDGIITTARIKVAAANNIFFDISDTNFTIDGCNPQIDADDFSFGQVGGSGTITVTAGQGCTWGVENSLTWVSVAGNGNGSGSASFTVAANTGGTRSGSFMVAGHAVTITQAGCGYTLSSTGQSFSNTGGNGSVTVTTGTGCPWTATSSDTSWLSNGGSGSGSGTVSYTVAHTNDGARTGTLMIAGQTFTVMQSGCAYSISPSSNQSCPLLGEPGATVIVSVTSGTNCSWSATVPRPQDQPWLHLNTSGGTGNSTVTYTADANLGSPNPPRSGQLKIAGIDLWIVQDGIAVLAKKCDFDGDGKTDLSVWRPSNGTWYSINSSNAVMQQVSWGAGYAPYFDVPVPGDYDGDGKIDQAIWRGQDSLWYIRKSTSGQPLTQLWGANYAPYYDVPVQGDYDGDFKTDIAVWRPTDGVWYVRRSSDGGTTLMQWGQSGDTPVPGDYDGDGKYDFAYWRPSDGTWYIKKSSGGTQTTPWGAGYAPYFDVPVQADYDGDGKTDLAIWRGQDSLWYIRKSSDMQPLIQLWGANYAPYNDVPVPGDYDGDGKADIAVWRPTDATWYVLRSTNGSYLIQAHGQGGDIALPSRQW